MKKNIGRIDAQIRITAGLLLLGIGIVKRSVISMAIGSCKVAEGVTRFCPILYALGLRTDKGENGKKWFTWHR